MVVYARAHSVTFSMLASNDERCTDTNASFLPSRKQNTPSKLELRKKKLCGTSTCVCNEIIRSFSKSYFHVCYRRRMPGTLAWQQLSLCNAYQIAEVATLLNSSFAFTIAFLSNIVSNIMIII